jgi:hypothetical protein
MKKYIFLFILVPVLLLLFWFSMQRDEKRQTQTKEEIIPNVKFQGVTYRALQARSPEEQRIGLSGRESLSEDEGMLFIFEKARYSSFWMREMKFPLDIIFILDNRVAGVFENLPPAEDEDNSPPTWGGNILSDHVFEVNAGQAEKYGIEVGDKVEINLK